MMIFALLLLAARALGTPVVTIDNGTIIGSSTSGIDSFLGIPYAQPPTGTLRLRAPSPVTRAFDTLTATSVPTACPQQASGGGSVPFPAGLEAEVANSTNLQTLLNNLSNAPKIQGEDCLTVNIQRPSTANPNSSLPVLFYIYGGAFETGTSQQYDGSPLIKKSVELGQDIVYVSVNYRLSAFGFLPGRQLQQEGNTNLGLRDQRLSLQWVQDNIAAFGGDPTKVTIFGESAGSVSVFSHLIIDGGDNSYRGGKLFRAAIMNSGMAYPVASVTSSDAQSIYDKVVKTTGCSGKTSPLACLRQVPYEIFLNASSSMPSVFSYQALDIVYNARPDPYSRFFPLDPYEALRRGNFARVPLLSGNQQDEGTLFSLVQGNISSNSRLIKYFSTNFFPQVTRRVLEGLISTYPDDPAAGSPYNTGTAYQFYPQFKRLASIMGDVCFILARRASLSSMLEHPNMPPIYSFLASYFAGTMPGIGTAHSTDLLLVFREYGPAKTIDALITHYVSFVNRLNPNPVVADEAMEHWPEYTTKDRKMMQFQSNSSRVITDTFRKASGDYLYKHRFALTMAGNLP